MPAGDPGGNFAGTGGYGGNFGGYGGASNQSNSGGYGGTGGWGGQFGAGGYTAGLTGAAGRNSNMQQTGTAGKGYNVGNWRQPALPMTKPKPPPSRLPPPGYTMPLNDYPDIPAGWHFDNPQTWNVTDRPIIGTIPTGKAVGGGPFGWGGLLGGLWK